jgi:hypothetical protein
MTDDINHTSVSALSSAMYNSDLKSSSSSSSQQPCGAENNFFYNDNNNNDYSQQSHNNQQQQQYSLHQEQLVHGPLTNPSLHRSSPITIQRSPSNRKKEIGDHLSRSIYDDDDDDDSDIDVEGDAIKLRRKYGNNIVQTYQPESSILSSTAAAAARTTNNRFRNHNRSLSTSASILNAPYFGSLSKSTNQILSLPPMSLGGGDNNITMYDDDGQVIVEPPESTINYGSLRDSHERGRFLDGPSSYREPMSGKIRQLDHRLRYHGSRQPAAELNNIGERLRERLQQSRKLKELRQKEENMKKKCNSNNKSKEGGLYNHDDNNSNDKGNDNNDDDNNTTYNKGEPQDQKVAGTSSLSAMMNEVSQSVSPPVEYSSLGPEILMPIETRIQDYHEDQISTEELPSPGRMMLSTSLTAFELLKTSNEDNIISDYDKRVASVGGQHGQSTTLLSLAPLVTTDSNNNNTVLSNLASLNTTQMTTTTEIRKPHNNDGFQVLARSMSDPSPRFYHNIHHSLQQSSGTTTSSANNISMFLPAATNNNNQTEAINNNNAIQQVPPYNIGQLLRENHHTSSPFISDHNNDTIMINGNGSRSHSDHDPNTDGAFGDMDME